MSKLHFKRVGRGLHTNNLTETIQTTAEQCGRQSKAGSERELRQIDGD